MTTKHTPGPWQHVSGTWVLGDDLFPVVCTSWPPDGARHGAEMRANAALIAAAPDLLAALEDVLPYLDDARIADGARAAIAKAKGETK